MTETLFKGLRMVWVVLFTGITPPGWAEEYKVLEDRSVLDALPNRWQFENLEARIFRNADGTALYLGPGPEGQFYTITGENQVNETKAPSTGKAYLNTNGQFAIWYDRLDLGVQFRDGHELKFKDPVRSRFGVAYGAEYFYTYEDKVAKVYKTAKPTEPVLTQRDFFLYKVVAGKDDMLLLAGFGIKSTRVIRTNLIQRWEKFQGAYQLMQSYEVPRHYQVLDLDPAHPRALLLNEAQLAPQVFDWDLKIDRILPIGTVDAFAIYMNKDFTIGEDMVKKFEQSKPAHQQLHQQQER